MLTLVIEAGILMLLMKTLNDDDVDFLPAVLFALFAALCTWGLTVALVPILGVFVGLLAAAVVGAGVIGFALAVVFGGELKRAVMIGGIFVICHIAISLAFAAMWAR